MKQPMPTFRSVLREMQRPGTQTPVDRPLDHEERLAAHERRIHNHPCPCGSGRRYVDCCIDRPNQEHLELKHRRKLARLRAGHEDV